MIGAFLPIRTFPTDAGTVQVLENRPQHQVLLRCPSIAGSRSLLISAQVDYDPFLFMQQNNKKYGFTSQSPPPAVEPGSITAVTIREYEKTIPSGLFAG
jgi:hypothetical protein